MRVFDYLIAGRADSIPKGDSGLWYTRKFFNPAHVEINRGRHRRPGYYTMLLRWTDTTMHLGHGDCVMIDDLPELRTHLQAAMTAYGNVLVTGLGLACVVRMLQLNHRVERITIVENSRDVIKLVWPFTSHDRCELIEADAVQFLESTDRRWDCAWHDLWTDTSKDEPHLQVRHSEMLRLCFGRVDRQGAWAFPRAQKVAWRRVGGCLIT